MTKLYQKQVKLAVHGRRTKWAPVWAVIKKYGPGKKRHMSEMTKIRRQWRKTKLKIKPRMANKNHLG